MGITHYIYLTTTQIRLCQDEAKLRGMYGNKHTVLSYGNKHWVRFNFVMVF